MLDKRMLDNGVLAHFSYFNKTVNFSSSTFELYCMLSGAETTFCEILSVTESK